MDSVLNTEQNKKVSFHTLGCRLNFSESGSIAQGFVDRGYEIVPFGEQSDVVFLNTCTVTDGADSTCRNLIRKAHRVNPESKIVVAGCYAQMDSERISRMQGVDLVLGTNEKFKVFEYLEEDQETQIKVEKTTEFWHASTTASDHHTRAFLKIQDGCNYVCSFCIIPFARGRSRTITPEDALKQAQGLVDQGYKEIVLTGVNVGEYDHTSGGKLSHLVESIVELPNLQRLRLSSVEPNTINDELLKVLKNSPKVMPHFHIPLQSGDDTVLKTMRRKYDSTFYRQLILKIADEFPRCAFGADIIAGHPGETDEQFENTLQLLRELPITHFHVFPFSKRKGTTSARLEDQLTHALKKERVKKLIELGEIKKEEYAETWVGETVEVLLEQVEGQTITGYSPQFLKTHVAHTSENLNTLKNTIQKVKIMRSWKGELWGVIVPQ